MIVLMLSAYSLLFCSASARERVASSGGRIAHGFKAKEGRFPFVVAIMYKHDQYFCAGTIITPKFVLTAAHCDTRNGPSSVVAGSNYFPDFEYRRNVKNFFPHPKYIDFIRVRYDVAIIELDHELPMIPRRVMFAKLPEYSTEVPDDYGTVAGWGVTKEGFTEPSPFLLAVCLKKVECKAAEEFFCLANPGGNQDSCAGDSGGPFLINRTVYGVVSFGVTDCGTGTPGRYMKVPLVVEWIRETAGIPESPKSPSCEAFEGRRNL
ncbi:trypsin 3A1-like [Coccinella septempunctata]|uniref:trypsin 3A1-like n=1 Tax=Coccinella septempunctata TaxID=41139 RepID=UPI001D061A11|nr:trypsin 3A1-like [Coccinella septempunctata]